MTRRCAFHNDKGEPCRAAPLRHGQFCLMHSPEHAQEVQEARKLGGLRRKREATVSVAYDVDGLDTVAEIRRLVQVAVIDTLGMENSISRARTLAYLAQVALRLLEVGNLEERIMVLEQAVHGNRVTVEPPVFDAEQIGTEDNKEQL